jgi:hypothetical protein
MNLEQLHQRQRRLRALATKLRGFYERLRGLPTDSLMRRLRERGLAQTESRQSAQRRDDPGRRVE